MTQPDHTYILESLEAAAPMLHNLALRHNLEFDDLYQQSYLLAYDRLKRDLGTIANLRAYIQTVIKCGVLDQVASHHIDMSLDAPLSEETSMSLADVLSTPEIAPRDESEMDAKEQALYAALRSLPLEDQQFMREVFQLNGYEVVPLYPYSRNNAQKTRHAVRQHAYRNLRCDERLREAVCS